MNEIINSVSAAAIANAADHIIEGGRDGQPPAYTEPSYSDRVDQWLQVFSVMPPTQRQHWFDYIRRYFNDEVEQEVNQRTSALELDYRPPRKTRSRFDASCLDCQTHLGASTTTTALSGTDTDTTPQGSK